MTQAKPFVIKCKARDINKRMKELREVIEQELDDTDDGRFLRVRL